MVSTTVVSLAGFATLIQAAHMDGFKRAEEGVGTAPSYRPNWTRWKKDVARAAIGAWS